MENKIVVVGLGGVGSWLLQGLCPYLEYSGKEWDVLLVDGDKYEPKNRTRQIFNSEGSKASVQRDMIRYNEYTNVYPIAIPAFIGEEKKELEDGKEVRRIDMIIKEGDIVFSCVDNHATRKLIQDYCLSLRDCVLISGGNEYTDGNVQVFIRQNANNKTPTIFKYHPEIAEPADKPPQEMSCEELAESSPQLIFMNLAIASTMLNVFYAIQEGTFNYQKSEIYLDIVRNAVTPQVRKI